MTIRVKTRLADGRDLLYYDRHPREGGTVPDRRPEPAAERPPSELRWNPLFGEYTVVAAHRQSRTHRPPIEACPLCPSRDGARTEIPAADYDVAVFENRFPSFARTGPARISGDPLFQRRPGLGRCEVVCFTSDHDRSFSQLSPPHVRTVIDAWADRTCELARADGIDYVYCFEDRGEEIGVTLSHAHGQIYGYPSCRTA